MITNTKNFKCSELILVPIIVERSIKIQVSTS